MWEIPGSKGVCCLEGLGLGLGPGLGLGLGLGLRLRLELNWFRFTRSSRDSAHSIGLRRQAGDAGTCCSTSKKIESVFCRVCDEENR